MSSTKTEQNPQAFINRYAVRINPDFINVHCIDQLNHALGAINPQLTKNSKGVLYLTADKFTNLTFLIEKAKMLGLCDSYVINGIETEGYHIEHYLFDCVSYQLPGRKQKEQEYLQASILWEEEGKRLLTE